jgi:methylenetetrahydrofolate reductase (NADPH)
VHFTSKDRNRNQIMAQLYAMERRGLHNLLVMSGDYTGPVWKGSARPVFDLDPIHMLELISEMNEGLRVSTFRGIVEEKPTHFFTGVAISPFKWTEAEAMTQYYKLEKKIAAGAQFAITQIGYDSRKMAELPHYLKQRGYDFPLIANIYVMTAGAAKYMRTGKVPGCYVNDELFQALTLESQAADKGRGAYLTRCAKVIAVARGLGYAGAHIGGLNVSVTDVETILEAVGTFQDDWQRWAEELQYGHADGFYLFDPQGELNIDVLPSAVCSAKPPKFSDLESADDFKESFNFIKKNGLLACPKQQRNGPCGGSMDGWCELHYDARKCVYIKAYHQLKQSGELEKLFGYVHPPIDWVE